MRGHSPERAVVGQNGIENPSASHTRPLEGEICWGFFSPGFSQYLLSYLVKANGNYKVSLKLSIKISHVTSCLE